MEAEMTYLLEEQARKLENAEMLIERLKREIMALSFSAELHDRAAEKALQAEVREELTTAIQKARGEE